MSALVRRNSSKEGLRNLIRVTAQRSVEDAEEAERERRRRAREAFRRAHSGSAPGEPGHEDASLPQDDRLDGSLKPSSSPASLEEDEGFSDWTQRRQRRRQLRLQEEEEEEEKCGNRTSTAAPDTSVPDSASGRLHRQQQTRTAAERRKECEEEDRAWREEELQKREEPMRTAHRREEIRMPDEEVEKRREMKVSYTSKVFLQQEVKHGNTNGDAAEEEVTSHSNKTKRSISRGVEADEAAAILETEVRLEKIRRSQQQKEKGELEQLRVRQAEAEQELEQLKRRREERRRLRLQEERRRDDEEQQRVAREEEERRRMKEDMERRRVEAAERMKSLSVEGDETFSPFSPKAPKITERTESLNRSLKKSNSFKKTQPPVLLSKIDDKLELYAHAVETSQELKAAKVGPADLPSTPEVASKKNLFEAGEAWSQSPTKAPTKEAEGLKVGVADLITAWVKGGPDGGNRPAGTKPTDVKPGDVMQKRNMWEIIGDSSGMLGQRARRSASGKKYKFIVTGHGKYEKMPLDDENYDGDDDHEGKSGLCHGDY